MCWAWCVGGASSPMPGAVWDAVRQAQSGRSINSYPALNLLFNCLKALSHTSHLMVTCTRWGGVPGRTARAASHALLNTERGGGVSAQVLGVGSGVSRREKGVSGSRGEAGARVRRLICSEGRLCRKVYPILKIHKPVKPQIVFPILCWVKSFS